MAIPVSQLSNDMAGDPVKDVSLNTFMVDVIEASRQVLVIVDFWATWCGPCKQLTPILEKLVRASKGTLSLAKIDIDRNPEIAQQMGVQSVPAVFGFYQGRPVDGFMGALPEAQIKVWIDRLIKSTGVGQANDDQGVEVALKQAAEFLAEQDFVGAQSVYMDVLELEPHNVSAYAGVLKCLLGLGETERAKTMMAAVPAEIAKDKALDPVRTALQLAAEAEKTGSLDEILARCQQNPNDLQIHFDLAMAYYAVGKKEEAVDELLEIVKRDRKWNEDGARKQLVKFFEAFGVMDPLTVAARKRLSSIMFS